MRRKGFGRLMNGDNWVGMFIDDASRVAECCCLQATLICISFPYHNSKIGSRRNLITKVAGNFSESFSQVIRHYGDKAFCGSKFREKWVQMEIFRVYLETEAKVELNNCFKLSGCEWKLWKFGKSSKDFYSITAKVGENNRGTLEYCELWKQKVDYKNGPNYRSLLCNSLSINH